MLTTAKIAFAAVLVLGATLSASAATKARVAHDGQSAASNIPGYDKDGGRIGVPNRDRQ
ncbi:MAG TPA: hypothetical protein VE396_06655 [Xanthobacteraceae bacterium]|jgi:hypothetical protein|nr:hypothetical protein [Xanthobacteraceae bacterium]